MSSYCARPKPTNNTCIIWAQCSLRPWNTHYSPWPMQVLSMPRPQVPLLPMQREVQFSHCPFHQGFPIFTIHPSTPELQQPMIIRGKRGYWYAGQLDAGGHAAQNWWLAGVHWRCREELHSSWIKQPHRFTYLITFLVVTDPSWPDV